MGVSLHMSRLLSLCFMLLALLGAPGGAQTLSLKQVTDKMEAARSGVQDISAKAQLGFQLSVGILPYNDTLFGNYSFKKPDRHRLDFPNAPSYLKSVPSMFSWKLPAPEKYDCKVTGPHNSGSAAPTYQLVFSSKNPDSKTSSITVTVNAKQWRVDKQDTLYRDGGSVLLSFSYIEQTGLPLLEKVAGKINIPSYSLSGNAAITLSDQKVNKGVDDSVFAL